MASSLAQQAAQVTTRQGLFNGKARRFYQEVCRCLPFVHRTMRLEEMVSVADMRSVVNAKFKEYKHVSNEKVVDLLIFKGREELENFLLVHKQRHHMVTEYLEPVIEKKRKLPTISSGKSAFLDGFLESNYAKLSGK